MPKEIIRYACGVCGSVYNTNMEALKCEELPIIKLPYDTDYQIDDKLEVYGEAKLYRITGFSITKEIIKIQGLPFIAHFSVPIINQIEREGIINSPQPLFIGHGEYPRIVERKDSKKEE